MRRSEGRRVRSVPLVSQPGLTDTSYYAELWHSLTVDSIPEWAGPLKELAMYRAAVDELTIRLIDDYRREGKTWEYIGAGLGMSAQGASQLHKRAKARR